MSRKLQLVQAYWPLSKPDQAVYKFMLDVDALQAEGSRFGFALQSAAYHEVQNEVICVVTAFLWTNAEDEAVPPVPDA